MKKTKFRLQKRMIHFTSLFPLALLVGGNTLARHGKCHRPTRGTILTGATPINLDPGYQRPRSTFPPPRNLVRTSETSGAGINSSIRRHIARTISPERIEPLLRFFA